MAREGTGNRLRVLCHNSAGRCRKPEFCQRLRAGDAGHAQNRRGNPWGDRPCSECRRMRMEYAEFPWPSWGARSMLPWWCAHPMGRGRRASGQSQAEWSCCHGLLPRRDARFRVVVVGPPVWRSVCGPIGGPVDGLPADHGGRAWKKVGVGSRAERVQAVNVGQRRRLLLLQRGKSLVGLIAKLPEATGRGRAHRSRIQSKRQEIGSRTKAVEGRLPGPPTAAVCSRPSTAQLRIESPAVVEIGLTAVAIEPALRAAAAAALFGSAARRVGISHDERVGAARHRQLAVDGLDGGDGALGSREPDEGARLAAPAATTHHEHLLHLAVLCKDLLQSLLIRARRGTSDEQLVLGVGLGQGLPPAQS
mmetsp:Transcript_36715/g.101371  ORF Transcript_36715/g.101371 Transcript_36715/m.101371 type:complete len:363 (-) Transcript_36715:69-1157(-)